MPHNPDSPTSQGAAPAVSVILPVYNVVDFIDECMESLVAQTFGDFEALLVDDGSTDGSSRACDAWAGRDARVRCIHQPNGGVSSARNAGIEAARGTYLAFVDPDDWLDPAYLQKLHDRLERTGAALVVCDLWRCDDRTGKKTWRSCGGRMGVPYTLEEHMKYGPTASYKAMSRRSLWIEQDVRFPSCSYESPAIFSLVLALAGGAEYIPEPLYYYRRFRPNSLVETGYAHKDGSPNNALGVDAMEHLVGAFERRGLMERFGHVLRGVVTYRLGDILATQFYRKSAEDYAEVVANYRALLGRTFGPDAAAPHMVLGGYNLNRVAAHMDALHDPGLRFNFSSIVALTHTGAQGGVSQGLRAHHQNRYRQMMVQRELDGAFWDVLERTRPALLLVDLMEERFDLIAWGGRILTASDALQGARLAGAGDEDGAVEDGLEAVRLPGARVIARDSDEASRLWEESCARFAQGVRRASPGTRVVIVRDYLAEQVGDAHGRRPHDDQAGIRAANEALALRYRLLEEALPEATVVDARAFDPYITDQAYEYGAIPSHLNEIVNQAIAHGIEEALAR